MNKLLIIEDSNDDYELAIASLEEAGEEFESTHVTSMAEAMHQLEFSPKNTYQKIYLDLSLPDVRVKSDAAFQALTAFVPREDIIIVSGSVDPKVKKSATAIGAKFLPKSVAFSPNNTDLAAFMFGAEADKRRSIERHKDLNQLEIKMIQLGNKVDSSRREIKLLIDRNREEIVSVRAEFSSLESRLIKDEEIISSFKSSLQKTEDSINDKNAYKLKRFELRGQLMLGVSLAVITALISFAAPLIIAQQERGQTNKRNIEQLREKIEAPQR